MSWKFSQGDQITIPIGGKQGPYTQGMVMGYGRSGLTYIVKHDAYEIGIEYTKDLLEQFAFVSKLSIKEQRMEEDYALKIGGMVELKEALKPEDIIHLHWRPN